MTGAGFYEQNRFSPTGLGIVVALHAAALGALALAKGPEIVRTLRPPTEIFNVPLPHDPPPVPPPPVPLVEPVPPPPASRIDRPTTVVDLAVRGPIVTAGPTPPPPLPGPIGTSSTAAVADVVVPPVRIAAEFDARFGDIQPPYPATEQRAQREGDVRVRVTIGADGRVKAVERLSATSDAFWRATERHALSRWRFRPATLDGRPVESVKVLNLHFQIEA